MKNFFININLKYFFIILVNFLIYIFLENFDYELKFNSIKILFPIINYLSLFIILFDIILNVRKSEIKESNINYVVYSFIFVFFLNINFILNGSTNIEFYNFNLISSIEYLNNLLKLNILFWSDSRALGIPMPIIPSLHFNPILIISNFFNLKFFYIGLFLSHSFLGTFFIMKLSNIFINNTYLNVFNGFLFSFSAPLINYMLTDDWTASFISYSLLPLIIFLILKILLCNRRYNLFEILCFSLIFFYYYYNSNPSFSFFLFFISLLFLILSVFYKLKIFYFNNLVKISILVFILILPNVIHIINELSRFPVNVEAVTGNKFYAKHWHRLISNFFPFIFNVSFDFPNNTINFNLISAAKIIITNIISHGYRNYFLGIVYCVISLISFVYILKQPKNSKNKILKILFIIFILSIILMHFKSFYFFYYVDEYYFGAIYVFLGIIMGSFFINSINEKYKNLATLLILIQSMQVLTYASLGVFIQKNSNYNNAFNTNFFITETNNDFFQWLGELKINDAEKIVLSPMIEYDLNKEVAVYKKNNLFSIQDFFYKKNIRVINDSSLKGISYDTISPSLSYKHGNLSFYLDLYNNSYGNLDHYNYSFRNKINLDILGADIFVFKDTELSNYSFSDELQFIDSIEITKIYYDKSDFRLNNIKSKKHKNIKEKFNNFIKNDQMHTTEKWLAYKNPKSFGDAFVISYPYIKKKYYSYNKKCSDMSFLCRENENLIKNKIGNVKLNGKNGTYNLTMNYKNTKTILVINKIFRKEWIAKSNNIFLKVFPVNNSLLGVEIPKGVNEIEIYYENKVLKNLYHISFLILFFIFIILPFSFFLRSRY